MITERLQPDEKTPRALARTVNTFENRFNQDLLPEINPASTEEYQAAFEYVKDATLPILVGLTVPEVYSRSTTYIDGKRQRDLTRRILRFSPHARFQGKSYDIGMIGIFDESGEAEVLVFDTSIGHDRVTIATLGRSDKTNELIAWSNNRYATREQLEEIKEIADFVRREAEPQAVKRGSVSAHWMERQADDWAPGSMALGEEGFPKDWDSYGGEFNLFEAIHVDGQREVVKVVKDGKKLIWADDVNPEIKLEGAEVVAWRRMGGVLPEYYSRLKYPQLYRHGAEELATAFRPKKGSLQSLLPQ